MNVLLVSPPEVDGRGVCAVDDRRAAHLRQVLKVRSGSVVRAGIAGGGLGTAEVLDDDGTTITLRLTLGPAPAPLDVELVLAIPRPKVLVRTVEIAASFAVRRIDLTNAWRVDKSYLASPRLEPETLTRAAWRGAEQGATTWLPELAVHRRLMPFLDERFPVLGGSGAVRLVAHPGAPSIERVMTSAGPTVLAIGPEGGWIERELDTLVTRGFAPVSLGAPILRVEAAVAAALGQLMLLHRIKHASPSS